MSPQKLAGMLFGIFVFSCFPRSAAAQGLKSWDAFAGYAFLRDAPSDVNFPLGWAAGVSGSLNSWLSIAADTGGNYKTIPVIGSDVRLVVHTFMIGGRASARVGDFVEFGELLVGLAHTRGTAFGSTSTATDAAVQGGAGLDYPLNSKLAARGELDARFLRTGHEFRVVAGLVYIFP